VHQFITVLDVNLSWPVYILDSEVYEPEQGMGRWVMGQMGHKNWMGHMGHGSVGVDP